MDYRPLGTTVKHCSGDLLLAEVWVCLVADEVLTRVHGCPKWVSLAGPFERQSTHCPVVARLAGDWGPLGFSLPLARAALEQGALLVVAGAGASWSLVPQGLGLPLGEQGLREGVLGWLDPGLGLRGDGHHDDVIIRDVTEVD